MTKGKQAAAKIGGAGKEVTTKVAPKVATTAASAGVGAVSTAIGAGKSAINKLVK